jgi:transcriptional regulator with PAS, ATPase and Fis domain
MSAMVRSGVEFIGNDAEIVSLLETAMRAAASDATILIHGENGTGKTLLAEYIHARSPRAANRFVTIRCGALPETLLESELFGDTFHTAIGGTVVVDGVAELPLRLQGLLLDTLERADRDFPVSSIGPTGIRVIATANRKLPELVASGQFREDLVQRLGIIELAVPSVRDRRRDIPLLANYFAERLRPVTFSPAAMRLLLRYRWPGNVRELRNAVEHSVFRTDDHVIPAEALPEAVKATADTIVLQHDRRSRIADELYDAIVGAGYSFWEHVHPLFLSRDITRQDLRELVHIGLSNARGSYRALLTLFGIESSDYKKFLNFLAAHDCIVDVPASNGNSGESGDRSASP